MKIDVVGKIWPEDMARCTLHSVKIDVVGKIWPDKVWQLWKMSDDRPPLLVAPGGQMWD